MNCYICSTQRSAWDKKICMFCYSGAVKIIDLMNKLETENGNGNESKSLLDASKWVVDLTEKQSFLHEFVDDYRNQTSSDILLKPGVNGSSIPAHKALLTSRSNILKNMMESDKCKTSLTLPELNHEELEAFLEILYRGSLPQEKLEKHVYLLLLVAHKYEIFYLQDFCENYMQKTFKHGRNIVFSAEYETFVAKNPHLSVQITRALLLMDE